MRHVNERLETTRPAAVAVALVLLRTDGSVDTSAIGVEPEFTRLLLRGMDSLAGTLRHENPEPHTPHLSHPPHPSRPPRQRGFAIVSALSALSGLGLIALAYVCEYAWLEAPLLRFA